MKTIKKGWGEEVVLHDGDGYTFKLLRFRTNSESSLHLHLKKTETWYVMNGRFQVTLIDGKTGNESTEWLMSGDTLHLPAGTPHQVFCEDHGVIVEASTPHSDDDVVRIKKGDSQK